MTHLRCAADAVDALEDAAAVGIAAGSGAVADDIAQRSASVNRFVRILEVPSLFSITPDKFRNNKDMFKPGIRLWGSPSSSWSWNGRTKRWRSRCRRRPSDY